MALPRLAVLSCLTLVLLPVSPVARAATYYVATTGSDSNSGTATSPFATIKKAAGVVKAGDTIIVQNGTYGPTGGAGSIGASLTAAGTAAAPITLKAASKYGAVLDCQSTCLAYLSLDSGSAYWIIEGFDITNGYDSGIYAYHGGSYSVIRGNIIEHIGNHYDSSTNGRTGVFASTYPGLVIDGNVFHDIGRTGVLTGNHDHAVYTYAPQMRITNNVCYNMLNGWCVQTASGFSGTIANNTFFGPDAILSKNGQMVLWGTISNVVVENNIFYGPTGYGISTAAPSISGSCTISHNIVYSPTATVGLIDSLPAGCTQSNNILNKNPLLASPALPNWNFQLTSGSPAIDAGVSIPGEITDFAGTQRPQGSAFDIGAYEFVGPSSSGAGTTTTTSGAGPAISGLGAVNVSNSGATIVWNTNLFADSAVDYGRTTGYGSTAVNAAKVTSHSVPIGGLASGSLYHYRVRSTDTSGNTTTSGDATFTTSGHVGIVRAPTPPTTVVPKTAGETSGLGPASVASPALANCVSVPSGFWKNEPFKAQTGTFTVLFSATPSMAKQDAVMGLSNGAASSYAGLAASVRFNNAGRIDARNGGSYAASAAIPYFPGGLHKFRLVVNATTHTYSAYVTPPGGTELTIGLNYAFRTEQATTSSISNLGIHDSTGGQTICALDAGGVSYPLK